MVSKQPTSFNPSKLQFLSIPELEQMKDVFNFEGHTHELHNLDKANKSAMVTKSYTDVKNDLLLSKENAPQNYLAYPFGQYNQNTIKLLKELNYKMVFTTKTGAAQIGQNLLEVKRYGIETKTTTAMFIKIVEGN